MNHRFHLIFSLVCQPFAPLNVFNCISWIKSQILKPKSYESPQLKLNFNSLRHEEVENAMVSVYCLDLDRRVEERRWI